MSTYVIDAFVANVSVTVVEKLALFPSAVANLFKVSNAGTAPPIRALILFLTYSVVASLDELFVVDCVVAVGLPKRGVSNNIFTPFTN